MVDVIGHPLALRSQPHCDLLAFDVAADFGNSFAFRAEEQRRKQDTDVLEGCTFQPTINKREGPYQHSALHSVGTEARPNTDAHHQLDLKVELAPVGTELSQTSPP